MAQININVTLDNIDQNLDPNEIANIIEGIVERYTSTSAETTIFDNDGEHTSNPIMTSQTLRRIKRV